MDHARRSYLRSDHDDECCWAWHDLRDIQREYWNIQENWIPNDLIHSRLATQVCCFRYRSTTFYISKREAFKHSSRLIGHTLPAQGKKGDFIWVAQSLSVTTLQRRLSGTSSCVFPTAACTTYANISYKRVASLLRLFAFDNSIQTSKPQAIRDRRPVKDSRWVLATAARLPSPLLSGCLWAHVVDLCES